MADEPFSWCEVEPAGENSALGRIARELARRKMFDPPLPGSLIAGRVLCNVPDSDVKYATFLEWWFAVGRKLPEVTVDGRGAVSGPYAAKGCRDAIPTEDWENLPESERDAIRQWADNIPVTLLYD